jgi:hypothetical protein
MAEILQPDEFENLRRSAAMGGLTDRTLTELLVSHQALLEERAELRQLVGRLGGSWAEHRAPLNAQAKILDDGASSNGGSLP